MSLVRFSSTPPVSPSSQRFSLGRTTIPAHLRATPFWQNVADRRAKLPLTDVPEQATENDESFILQEYIGTTFLPTFLYCRNPIARVRRAPFWPGYPELKKDLKTRPLRLIETYVGPAFVEATKYYFKQLPPIRVRKEDLFQDSPPFALRLPDPELINYDDDDVVVLSHVDNEQQFLGVVKFYILDTISEIIRLIEDIPRDDVRLLSLEFQNCSSLCSAHHARWDIFSLPLGPQNPDPIFIIMMQPSSFGLNDFREFTARQQFQEGMLDSLQELSDSAPRKLWAVVHDICRNRGHRFIVSNYVRWVFGKFDASYSVAHVTESYEAEILEFDGSFLAYPSLGFTLAEHLTFWVQASRGQPTALDAEQRLYSVEWDWLRNVS